MLYLSTHQSLTHVYSTFTLQTTKQNYILGHSLLIHTTTQFYSTFIPLLMHFQLILIHSLPFPITSQTNTFSFLPYHALHFP